MECGGLRTPYCSPLDHRSFASSTNVGRASARPTFWLLVVRQLDEFVDVVASAKRVGELADEDAFVARRRGAATRIPRRRRGAAPARGQARRAAAVGALERLAAGAG